MTQLHASERHVGYDPEGTRRRIVESALALFAERGYDGTSVQEVADSAGLTKGAFYHHFVSKAHLLAALFAQYLDHLDAALAAAGEGADPLLSIHSLARAQMRVIAEHREHALVFHHERHHLTEPEFATVAARAANFDRGVVARIEAAQAAGRLREEPGAEVVAKTLLGSLLFSLAWWRPSEELGAGQFASQVCAILFRGVALATP